MSFYVDEWEDRRGGELIFRPREAGVGDRFHMQIQMENGGGAAVEATTSRFEEHQTITIVHLIGRRADLS